MQPKGKKEQAKVQKESKKNEKYKFMTRQMAANTQTKHTKTTWQYVVKISLRSIK